MREERRGKFARKTPSTDYFYAPCPPRSPLPASHLAVSPFTNANVLQEGEGLRGVAVP